MPLPILADHFRTISTFSNVPAGNPFSVSMDFDASGNTEPITDATIAASLAAAWVNVFASSVGALTYDDFISDEVELLEIVVYDLTGLKAPLVSGPFPGVTGVATATPLPPDLAMVCTKRTATRGRKARGRFYMGGFVPTAVESGGGIVVPSDFAAAYEANLMDLANTSGVESTPMCVISQADVLTGESFEVTSLTVDSNWDVQRRRGRG